MLTSGKMLILLGVFFSLSPFTYGAAAIPDFVLTKYHSNGIDIAERFPFGTRFATVCFKNLSNSYDGWVSLHKASLRLQLACPRPSTIRVVYMAQGAATHPKDSNESNCSPRLRHDCLSYVNGNLYQAVEQCNGKHCCTVENRKYPRLSLRDFWPLKPTYMERCSLTSQYAVIGYVCDDPEHTLTKCFRYGYDLQQQEPNQRDQDYLQSRYDRTSFQLKCNADSRIKVLHTRQVYRRANYRLRNKCFLETNCVRNLPVFDERYNPQLRCAGHNNCDIVIPLRGPLPNFVLNASAVKPLAEQLPGRERRWGSEDDLKYVRRQFIGVNESITDFSCRPDSEDLPVLYVPTHTQLKYRCVSPGITKMDLCMRKLVTSPAGGSIQITSRNYPNSHSVVHQCACRASLLKRPVVRTYGESNRINGGQEETGTRTFPPGNCVPSSNSFQLHDRPRLRVRLQDLLFNESGHCSKDALLNVVVAGRQITRIRCSLPHLRGRFGQDFTARGSQDIQLSYQSYRRPGKGLWATVEGEAPFQVECGLFGYRLVSEPDVQSSSSDSISAFSHSRHHNGRSWSFFFRTALIAVGLSAALSNLL